MSTHFRILAERRKKDPTVRDFVIDEYAPIYHAAKDTPYMKFYCGDFQCDWPARVEENQLLAMRMQRVYKNKKSLSIPFPAELTAAAQCQVWHWSITNWVGSAEKFPSR